VHTYVYITMCVSVHAVTVFKYTHARTQTLCVHTHVYRNKKEMKRMLEDEQKKLRIRKSTNK